MQLPLHIAVPIVFASLHEVLLEDDNIALTAHLLVDVENPKVLLKKFSCS